MENKTSAEFEQTIKFLNFVLIVCGSNVLEKSWCQGIFGKVLWFFPTLIIGSLPILNVIAMYYNRNDFMKFTDTVMSSGSCIQTVSKLVILQIQHQTMRSLVETCRAFRNKYKEDIQEEDEISTETNSIKHPITIIKPLYYTYWVATIVILVSPLLAEERILPLCYYLPLGSPFETPLYEITYILHVFIQIPLFHILHGVDSSYILVVTEACLQHNVIKYKLAFLGTRHENIENEELRKIQEMHQNLVSLVHEISKMFSIILLTTFMSSLLLISTILFLTISTGNMRLLPLGTAVLAELTIYCVYGQFLKNKLDHFYLTLYDNNWYNLTIKQKKSLIMMLSYAQVNLCLKAKGFAEVSLATYLQILKTAYTYCAVMQDVQTKE